MSWLEQHGTRGRIGKYRRGASDVGAETVETPIAVVRQSLAGSVVIAYRGTKVIGVTCKGRLGVAVIFELRLLDLGNASDGQWFYEALFQLELVAS
ncbi:MAG: hypothetical protein IPP91_12630 [Betaproteobacteria bacterium]|nr:hypothetical protein [Betaproteobacteria bacterium]